MPRKCCLKSSENGSAIESIGMPLVFEAMTAPGFRYLFYLGKYLVLDLEIFDHGLDDEVAIL